MSEVYNQIPEEFIGEEIVFLSISFDPTVMILKDWICIKTILIVTEKHGEWPELKTRRN